MLASVGKFSLNHGNRIIGSITIRCTHRMTKMAESQFFTEIESLEEQQPTIKCRNRDFFAGSTSSNLPETLPKFVHKNFKAITVNKSNEGLAELGGKLYPFIENYIDQSYSAILIKNLPIKEAKDFNALVAGFEYKPMNYEAGNGFRDKVVGTIYTASDEPPEFSIEPHNEMSYLFTFPKRVSTWFFSS